MQLRVGQIIAIGTLALAGCGVVDSFKQFVGGNDPDPVTTDGGTADAPDAGGPFCVPPEIQDPMLTPGKCATGEWCRLLDPQGFAGSNSWFSLSVAADDDVWVSGLRWKPDATLPKTSISHWDGKQWTDVVALSSWGTAGIWANPHGKLWLAGGSNAAASWDGKELTEYTTPDLRSITGIWGASDSDVWITGAYGGVAHWDGAQWSRIDSGTASGIWSLWGADASHVWMGLEGFALLWDGASIAKYDVEDFSAVFANLTGSGALDAWSGKYRGLWHWDGVQWTEERAARLTDKDLYDALWSRGLNDLWAARGGGGFRHWDRSQWSPLGCGFQPIVERMSGTPSGDAWAIGGFGPIVRLAGDDRRARAFLPHQSFDLISGSSPSDVWIASSQYFSQRGQSATVDGWKTHQETMLHWDGEHWATFVLPDGSGDPKALHVNSRSDAWALIADALWHWDGASWSKLDTGEVLRGHALWSLWGTGADDVWVIADRALFHWDGVALSAVDTGLHRDVEAVSGTSRDDVWAWTDTSIIHWDGTKWTDWTDATGDTLDSVVQVLSGGDGHVWVASQNQFSHWDGEQWAKLPQITFDDMEVGVLSAVLQDNHELWVLGGNGKMANIVVRWDGSKWVEVTKGLGTGGWRTLWAASPTEVWAVGSALNVYRLKR